MAGGGIGGAPYKKNGGENRKKKNSMQGVGVAVAGGRYRGGGPPIKKYGSIFFTAIFYSVPIQLSRGPSAGARSRHP